MDPTSSQPFQQSEGDAGRSYVKCDFCRERHKKCLPASRIWPGRRCTACEEADLICGPSLHWKDSSWSGSERRPAKRARTQPGLGVKINETYHGEDAQRSISLLLSTSSGQSCTGTGLLPASAEQRQPHPLALPLPHQLPTPHKQTQVPPIPFSRRASLSSPTPVLPSDPFGSTANLNHYDAKSPLSTSIEKNSDDPTQDGLVPRLIHLGYLCILYEYWKGLEAASNPPLTTEYGQAISSNIKFLARCTTYHVQLALKAIIGLIEVEGKSTESQNLRYREALDTVEDINKLGSRSEVLVELEITILSKLILIYEQQEDAPTVRRFSRRRSMLHHESSMVPNACHIEHTAQCWVETTGKLPALLDSLDLQVEAPLHANGTPLFPAQQSALRYGHDDVAKVLCKLDGALQNLDMLKQDPILAAAAVGKLPLLEKLVQNDKSLLRSRDLLQRTALFHTACRGNVETFSTLVKAGAKVDDRDEAGQSILGAASAAGNMDVVKWLLGLGGIESPNDHIFGPRSPLHDAARAGHTPVCSLLLEKGAYVDYLVDNVTPAQAARANGFDDLADMLELSLANPANQHPFNRSYDNPLPQNLSNETPSLDVRHSNPYACPTPLPFEGVYANFEDEINRNCSTYKNGVSSSSTTEDEVTLDVQPLGDSINLYHSSRLFGG